MQCGQKKKKTNKKRDCGAGGMILGLQLVTCTAHSIQMSTGVSVVQGGKKAVHAFKYWHDEQGFTKK